MIICARRKSHQPARPPRARVIPMILGTTMFAVGGVEPLLAQSVDNGVDAQATEGLRDIIVTARKRAERLQDVPESISAFDSERIEAADINDVKDLAQFVPNFAIRETQQPGAPLINIRGITQFYTGEQPIALVIDGVQSTDFSQITQELFDVESIEVLKGPQGSVYGRNAIGGAINIRTKQPTNEYSGFAKMGFAKFDDQRLSAGVSGPLIGDNLLFRIAGSLRNFDGDIPFPNTPYGKRVNWQKDRYVRSLLVANIANNLSLDVRYAFQDTKGGVGPYVALAPGQTVERPYPYLGAYPNRGTRRLHDASAKLEFDLNGAMITSITAYSKVRTLYDSDGDYGTADLVSVAQHRNNSYISQELRVSSDGNQRLTWLAGLYYLDTRARITTDLYARADYLPLLGLPPELSPYLLSPAGVVNNNDNYAVFGQAAYRMTDGFEISAGLRFDADQRRQRDLVEFSKANIEKTFKSIQPKISVTYKFNPDNMIYSTVGKGFRSGGFNHNDNITRVYKKEEVWNYEVGYKSNLANRRLNLTAAAFYQAIKDRQVFAYDFDTAHESLANPIPKSRVMGIEADLNATPIRGMDLAASIAFTRSKILRYNTSVLAGTGLGDFTGNHLPEIPKISYSFSGQYKINVGTGSTVTPRVEVNGSGGSFYWAVTNRTKRRDNHLVNLRLTIARGDWSITGYVENLFDKRYVAEVFEGELVGTPGTDYNAYRAGLRAWGVTGRVAF